MSDVELPPLPDRFDSVSVDDFTGQRLSVYTASQMEAYARAAIATLAQQRVPDADEPDQALLISMATCLNHGFGLLGPQQQASMLHDMRKLWDEVQGRGYYTPANRGRYLAALNDNDPLADFNAAVNSQPVARNA